MNLNIGIKDGICIILPQESTIGNLRARLSEFTPKLSNKSEIMVASYTYPGMSGVSEEWIEMIDREKLEAGMMLRAFLPGQSDRFFWFFTCDAQPSESITPVPVN